MDLGAARCGDAAVAARERARFNKAIEPLLNHDGPKLLVTDSQVGIVGRLAGVLPHLMLQVLICSSADIDLQLNLW